MRVGREEKEERGREEDNKDKQKEEEGKEEDKGDIFFYH